MKDKVSINLLLDPQIAEALKALAIENDRSVAAEVRRLIKEAVGL